MKGLIDTNILIYASSGLSPEYPQARSFLDSCLKGPSFFAMTWINLGEYLAMSTKSFGGNPPLLEPKEAQQNIQTIMDSDFIQIVHEGENHWSYLSEIINQAGPCRGHFIHDCRIASIMKENGIDTIYTRDVDFRKIINLKVVNPFDTP